MGGKQKQAQRTKGSVKPSSSGRSAALLTTTGLSGLPGLKDTIFPSFHTTTLSEEIDATLDPNFQLVLKKMNKKDPTTRVKALQEFIKLVETCDPEVLKAVLPFWPRLYCSLVGDIEHRVREVANDAHRSVVVQAKRNMAPYLRSLAGPWFIAQFDTYPPAASAAVRAFQEAFPPNKLVEVIIFCQEEILKYISDNLLEQSAGKQDNSERTEKQERIIITSLQGFCHYIKIVQDDLLSKPHFLQISDTLLQSQQFWKLGIDKVPLVRSAWLSVMSAILEKVPHLLKEHHQLLVKRILGRLDETDAIVIPYVWQAALNILVRLDDWSKYCDVNKQVFPKLWNILREGGYGCANTIFPNMLPLLNSLLETKETPSDKEIIVDSFFKSLLEGFEKKTVQHSKSESEAVSLCYIECVRLVVKCGVSDSKLILNHLMPAIELTLTESKFSLLSRGLFEHISRLLRYWSSDKCASQYETICKCFWDTLLDMFKKVLLQAPNDSVNTYILSQEVLLCSSLKDPDKFKSKSVHRVRFNTDSVDNGSSESEKHTIVDPLCESKTHSKYLKNFIMSVSSFYLQRINVQHDLCCVVPLAKLLSEFNDHELIEHLVLNCNVSELFSTLSKKCFASSGQHGAIVVELACSMIQHLEPGEREEILNTVCQEPDVLVYIFRAAQEEKIKPYILQWLQTQSVSNQLIKLTQEFCVANSSSNIKAVLMECVAKTSDGAFLVNVSTISSIISELTKTTVNAEIATFASQFLSNLQISISRMDNLTLFSDIDNLSENVYKLIVHLFCFCCDEETASNSIKDLVSSGWQNGVNVLSRIAPTHVSLLVTDLSGIVRKKILSSDVLSLEDVENLVEISLKLLTSSNLDVSKMCSLLLKGVLFEYELLEHKLTVHCGNIIILLGIPACNLKMDHHSVSSEEIFQYIILSLFTSMFIMRLIPLEHVQIEEKEDTSKPTLQDNSDILISDSCDSQNDWEEKEESQCFSDCQPTIEIEKCDEILLSDSITQRIMQLALATSSCEIYSTFFQNMPIYNKAGVFISALQDKFSKIKSYLWKKEKITYIKDSALEKANQYGGLWIPTVYLLSREEEWITVHRSLSNSSYGEYSARVLFKKTFETSAEISIESIGDDPSISEITFWIKYMKVTPGSLISSVITSCLSKWLEIDRKELLYDCDISTKPSSEVENVVKKIYFLSACIQKCPFFMEQRFWDFIIISAAYYAQNLKHIQKFYVISENMDNIIHVQNLYYARLRNASVFSLAVFELLSSVTDFCQCVQKKELYVEYNFEDQANEWKNVFADDVRSVLTNIFISLSGYPDKMRPSFLGHIFLQKFCSLMIKINEKTIDNGDSSIKLEGTILTACCKLLRSPVLSLQITAYYIFKTYLNHLVEKDSFNLTSNQSLDDMSDQWKFEIFTLLRALQDTQTVVDTMLADFSFGDSCIIQPHTDSYYYTAAYLLLWNLLLQACNIAGSELRYQYATHIRNEGYLASLLNNSFILMPSEVLETTLPKAKSTTLVHMFSEVPQLSIYKECTSQQLQHWACWIYFSAVSRLPALVRQWWTDSKSKVSSIVQKATVQYVTPLLCTRDLQAVQNQKTKWKNMEVKVHSKARQVVAIYSVDEAQMELIITLPEEYPLATIQVDSHTSSLVGTSQWRNWVKQLSIFLTHQNGSLWDGLLLWKSNLDKMFEGVEECYICFSILHGTNFQIPKLCCKTCKKKFHSPCLYKWFSTSNKSTCPICRNMF